MGTMWHINTKHTILFNKTKFTPYHRTRSVSNTQCKQSREFCIVRTYDRYFYFFLIPTWRVILTMIAVFLFARRFRWYIQYKFKRYFCGNWPIFVFLRRNHTRAETQCAQKLFLNPTRTMVSSGNGPLPRCVVGVWPKLGHRRPLHIRGHHRCARSRYRPPPSLSFRRLSTMGVCVTDFFGHDNCYCHR